MTQRIFDIENEKDMADLWDILPECINKIEKSEAYSNTYSSEHVNGFYETAMLKINWHDKTKITRPRNYDDVIGCVGWFWDGEEKPVRPHLSILSGYDNDGFWTVCRNCFEHFMTAKKSELKFYGE